MSSSAWFDRHSNFLLAGMIASCIFVGTFIYVLIETNGIAVLYLIAILYIYIIYSIAVPPKKQRKKIKSV